MQQAYPLCAPTPRGLRPFPPAARSVCPPFAAKGGHSPLPLGGKGGRPWAGGRGEYPAPLARERRPYTPFRRLKRDRPPLRLRRAKCRDRRSPTLGAAACVLPNRPYEWLVGITSHAEVIAPAAALVDGRSACERVPRGVRIHGVLQVPDAEVFGRG